MRARIIPQQDVLASTVGRNFESCSTTTQVLLAIQSRERSRIVVGTAKWIDIQPSTPRVERLHMQETRCAGLRDITEHTFHALLVKLLMLTVRQQVLQE